MAASVEVSGGTLALTGKVDVSAPKGTLGTILLDPRDLTITANSNGTAMVTPSPTSPNVAYNTSGTTTDSYITPAQIQALTGNVDIQTTRNLTVASSVSYTGGSLTLQAGNNLTINTGITVATTAGALNLTAASTAIPGYNPAGMLSLAGTVTSSGLLTLSAGTGGIQAGGGSLQGSSIVFNQPIAVTANETLQTTGTGAFSIVQPISVAGSSTLTITAAAAIAVDAPITITGAGQLALNTGTTTIGNTTQPLLSFGNGASVSYTGTPGSGQALTINGTAYELVYTMAESAALTGGSDALAVNLTPTASYTAAVVPTFSGTLEGLGHTVTGLTIASTGDNVGLIGTLNSGGTVRDFGIVGGSVSGNNYVGGLVGENDGTITQAYATGAVNGSHAVGGLVGGKRPHDHAGLRHRRRQRQQHRGRRPRRVQRRHDHAGLRHRRRQRQRACRRPRRAQRWQDHAGLCHRRGQRQHRGRRPRRGERRRDHRQRVRHVDHRADRWCGRHRRLAERRHRPLHGAAAGYVDTGRRQPLRRHHRPCRRRGWRGDRRLPLSHQLLPQRRAGRLRHGLFQCRRHRRARLDGGRRGRGHARCQRRTTRAGDHRRQRLLLCRRARRHARRRHHPAGLDAFQHRDRGDERRDPDERHGRRRAAGRRQPLRQHADDPDHLAHPVRRADAGQRHGGGRQRHGGSHRGGGHRPASATSRRGRALPSTRRSPRRRASP